MLPDVNLREVLVLAPVLALLLVFGVYPKLLTDRIDPTAKASSRTSPPVSLTDVGGADRAVVRARTEDRALMPTPKLVFAPILPELVLCGVAIVGLLYEAIARRPTGAGTWCSRWPGWSPRRSRRSRSGTGRGSHGHGRHGRGRPLRRRRAG